MNIFRRPLIIVLIMTSSIINSQDLTDNLKVWSGISLKYGISENLDVKFSQLFSHNVSPTAFSFAQSKLALSYKIKRRTYVETGYVSGLFNDSRSLRDQGVNTVMFNKLAIGRIYANFSFKHDIVKRLSLRHKPEIQYFFTSLEKYQVRAIYAARLSYNVRRSSLAPYLENQFFYYTGGDISSGIKRYRLKPGVNFKPFEDFPMGVSIYYIIQKEFGTDNLPENDYNVLGFNLSFTLK
tara:strand:+ start:402 stop:1115 length:714 start_codon:yes stop_codon:yes gene_type:complete